MHLFLLDHLKYKQRVKKYWPDEGFGIMEHRHRRWTQGPGRLYRKEEKVAGTAGDCRTESQDKAGDGHQYEMGITAHVKEPYVVQ